MHAHPALVIDALPNNPPVVASQPRLARLFYAAFSREQ